VSLFSNARGRHAGPWSACITIWLCCWAICASFNCLRGRNFAPGLCYSSVPFLGFHAGVFAQCLCGWVRLRRVSLVLQCVPLGNLCMCTSVRPVVWFIMYSVESIFHARW
jgi:hypothetical protein